MLEEKKLCVDSSRLICSLVLTFVANGAVSAATWVVDNDRVQCPAANFTSIQAAVAAASSGDTINVCPGLYMEMVLIDKSLILNGAGPVPSARSGDVNTETVVDPPNTGFVLFADNIKVEGFTFQDAEVYAIVNGGGGLPPDPTSFTGWTIRQNFFQRDGSAISLFGPATFSNLEISKNVIRQGFTGIEIQAGLGGAAGGTNVQIKQNQIADELAGITLGGGLNNATVASNSLARLSFVGIELGSQADNVDVSIAGNDITQASFAGITLGGSGISQNSNVVADNNDVVQSGNGIYLANATDTLVRNNRLQNNLENGISVVASSDNTLSGNRSTTNTVDGIRVDSFSTDNIIDKNHMSNNGEHDAHDDSVGSGTAGTASFWIKNHCTTENHVGLCK